MTFQVLISLKTHCDGKPIFPTIMQVPSRPQRSQAYYSIMQTSRKTAVGRSRGGEFRPTLGQRPTVVHLHRWPRVGHQWQGATGTGERWMDRLRAGVHGDGAVISRPTIVIACTASTLTNWRGHPSSAETSAPNLSASSCRMSLGTMLSTT